MRTESPSILFSTNIPSGKHKTSERTGYTLSSSHPTENLQFSSVAQSCPTLCDPMNCSTPGLPVHHQLCSSNGKESAFNAGDQGSIHGLSGHL